MNYLGGRITLVLKSKQTLENDLKMYKRLRELSQELANEYDVQINLEHEPFYENKRETISYWEFEDND